MADKKYPGLGRACGIQPQKAHTPLRELPRIHGVDALIIAEANMAKPDDDRNPYAPRKDTPVPPAGPHARTGLMDENKGTGTDSLAAGARVESDVGPD
jgi:hypothetical protein